MRVIPIILLFLSPVSGPALAQAISTSASYRHIASDNWLRIQYENDLFRHTDYYYSQGVMIEGGAKGLGRTPLHHLFVRPKGAATRYGALLEQDAYTPTSIIVDTIQYGDRPYAATLFLKAFAIARTVDERGRLYSALTVGLIGPAAGGYEMQAGIHRQTGDAIPKGWQHQIRGDILLNYEAAYERLLWTIPRFTALTATGSARAGTLSTKAGFSVAAMAGRIPAAFAENDGSKWNAYVYASIGVDAVAYDATMQGGLFSNGEVYSIPRNDIERIVPAWRAGAVLRYAGISVEGFTQYLAPEFRNGRSHRVGGFRLGIGF